MLKEMRLISYGNGTYCRDLFDPISDREWTKPSGGLWASPVASEWGWKEWAESESFGDLSNFFELEFRGNVFEVDSEADMMELPWIDSFARAISFQAIEACGYDAVHLTEKGERNTRWTSPKSLYGWDCETVLIMNPDSIIAAYPQQAAA